ncbi:hypothetical protein EPN83_01530 [Patescibacteria group bacterium]|nr:MAG: hypothetical protein EPN83_01530 [Patescibacteria group bacterium]
MTAKAVTTAQLEQIRKMAKEKGVSRDQFQLGLDNGMFARTLDELIVGKVTETPTGLFRLAVDWGRTTEEMVRACQYDCANPDITEEHFPRPRTSGVVKGDYKLFHFNRNISSDQAVREIRAEGFELTGAHEILVFREKFPEEQRKFTIVGLGDPLWRRDRYGYRHVVVLRRHEARRSADLTLWEVVWPPLYRFLARRLPAGQAGK